MAKLNITFVDELGSNLNRYKAIDVNTGNEYLFDLSRNGTITTQGTPLNAENMNLIVQAINNIELSYIKSITQDENGKIIITKQDDTILDLNIANVVEESVQCPHRYEITGNTGDEHNLAINDQQMLLDRVQGRTLVKNQLFNKDLYTINTQTTNNVTYTNNGDGSITITVGEGGATAQTSFLFNQGTNFGKTILLGRKYFIKGAVGIEKISLVVGGQITQSVKGIIFTATNYEIGGANGAIRVYEGCPAGTYIIKPQLIDLTLKYGAGKEPITVEQVLNDMQGYEEYDLGSFIHSKNNLISTGRNIWDEEWETGFINSNGVLSNSTIAIRSKNYINVLPNTKYYIKSSITTNVFFYDINKQLLSYYTGQEFSTPSNCYFIKFYYGSTNNPINTYNNDICINVFDESFNGKYEPYQEDIMVVDRDLKAFEYIDNITNEKANSGAFVEDMSTMNWGYNSESAHWYTNDLKNKIKIDYNNPGLIAQKYSTHAWTNRAEGDITMDGGGVIVVPSTDSLTKPSGMLYYETITETREPLELPRGMAVWGNGMQIQKGTIPYLLTKTYSLSIGAQVKANIQIDKEQQDQINNLKNEHKELREDFDNTFSNQNVKRETSALIDYPSKELSYPNQQVTVDEIRGRSLNVNQLAQPTSWSAYNGSLTNVNNSNKETTVTIVSDSSTYLYTYGVFQSVNYTLNHKYLFKVDVAEQSITNLAIEFGGTYYDTLNKGINVITVTISKALSSDYLLIYPRTLPAIDSKFIMKNIEFIDLTAMYGAGNEPTDVNQVLIDIDKFKVDGYLPYNLGELKDVEFSGVKSVGVNIWDEEWELGSITDGNNVSSTTYYRSKNFIPILSNTTYYGKTPNNIYMWYYDINKNYISSSSAVLNSIFTTPNNVYYMRWSGAGTTYNHDICINISNKNINGQYFPYEEDIYEIPQVDLKSAGAVYDALLPTKGKFVKRIGVVEDMGTLDWVYEYNNFRAPLTPYAKSNTLNSKTSYKYVVKMYYSDLTDKTYMFDSNNHIYVKDTDYTDVASFKASLQGVKLYYELATPVESDIVCPNNYKAWQYGIEMQLGNFPTTIIKDYSISILDQITKNVEVDKNQSDLIEKTIGDVEQVNKRINEVSDNVDEVYNTLDGKINDLDSKLNFEPSLLKIEQNLVNTILKYNNKEIDKIENLDVVYLPNIVFDVYQDSQTTAQEKVTITNSTDMDMYVSIKGLQEHNNLFVPFGESVTSQLTTSISSSLPDSYIATIEIKIYYNQKTNNNTTRGYTVFENVKTINLRATVYPTDK